jgi:hypothetical protein
MKRNAQHGAICSTGAALRGVACSNSIVRAFAASLRLRLQALPCPARLESASLAFGSDSFFAKLGTRSGKDAVLYVVELVAVYVVLMQSG